MTTHRLIQIHNLLDTCESKACVCRRGADNLARIGNAAGTIHQLKKAMRFERIASKCRSRLEVA